MANNARADGQPENVVGPPEKSSDRTADNSGPQEIVDKETEQGFRGVEVDPTPNEHYTLEGVTAGRPTPETDPDAAEQARQALADTARRAAGVAER